MKIGQRMPLQGRVIVAASVAICAGIALGAITFARARANPPSKSMVQDGAIVTEHASGTFDVKLAPVGEPDKADGLTLGTYSLEKQYHGDLEASAKGTMLTAGTEVKGSAGYVAIERVTGALKGHKGSFVLQHNGTLTRGAPQQNIVVVPDSGTGQLTGLTGKLTVIIENGNHSYEFDYSLPPSQ
jgi:hypothetical protein